MLDIVRIRNNPELVRAALAKRLIDVDFTSLLEWDVSRRALITSVEELKAKLNKGSSDIPRLRKNGENTDALQAELKTLEIGRASCRVRV